MSTDDQGTEIQDIALSEALGERYLSYALSTITSRSLPDVRDGLKPVHRRLLFAMRELKLDPRSGFKKCARIVGDVMGKYHPHGDGAIYDAMVRLAQEFSQRYPLVDGQGNFGNVDGDNPAAMRYTEARLTAIAEAMLDGIDEDAVDFRETYDSEGLEPVVLPAAFPNLLANGAAGIAVGMATAIPPHNAGELCDALLHLINNPDASVADLLVHVKGPDLPTGGLLAEDPETILSAYETGRGGFRVRARWAVERQKGGTYQIVVTEIPYQVQKSKLVERIADLIINRKVPLLGDVRDESTDDIRLVLEPRSRNVEPEMLMEALFRHSELESRVSLNMNVLDMGRAPRVMSLKEVLAAFLTHRDDVLVRRSRHRLEKIAHRLEVLSGYMVAYLNLDEVIRIIREDDAPKAVLIARFDLTDVQAEAILNMRLRSLRKLEELEIKKEIKALRSEQKALSALVKNQASRWRHIAEQIADIKIKFGGDDAIGRRRTTPTAAPTGGDVPIEAIIEREPITVLLSRKGWIRAAKGHLAADAEQRYKDGDGEFLRVNAETTDKLLMFATNGRFYTMPADKLPGGRGFGEPLRLMVDLGNDHDVVTMMVHRPGRRLLVAASDGRGFVVPEEDAVAQTRAGRQVLNVSGDVEGQICIIADGDHVAILGENRKLLIFPVLEIPEMSRGRGVILQKFRDGGLADVKIFTLVDGLTWKLGERERRETDLTPWLGKRAQAGRMPPQGFPRNNRFG